MHRNPFQLIFHATCLFILPTQLCCSSNATHTPKIDDATMVEDIKIKIGQDEEIRNSNISVSGRDNVITLQGSVQGEESRAKAEHLAMRAEGVKEVVNLLKVEEGKSQRPCADCHTTIRVFYGTDRVRINSSSQRILYGKDRGDISYGFCDVSIPRDHKMGEIERPFKVLSFELKENLNEHVVIVGALEQDEASFRAMVRNKVQASTENSAFVFVHGYNVDFDDAARRTAQIAYDLGFDGAPIFYSWPSQGTYLGYPKDETNVEWTQAHLENFLGDILDRSGAKTVHLIAHSMGNRALTRALISLLSRRSNKTEQIIKSVILTAPDIDADVFRRDIAPALRPSGARITLYASSEDRAIKASREFHGYPRAGEAGAGLVLEEGLETVDASFVDTDLIGHSYFADNRSVLSDIFYIVRQGLPADKRAGLRRVNAKNGGLPYWTFRR